jgi:putative flavoprotein involved in K+ transport
MELPSTVETVVVGAGQAGLVMSSFLSRAGREHVVLDRRSTLGGGWQDRWDAFRLVTPNWIASFPGDPYQGGDPDGFMPRDEITARVAGYAEVIAAPVVLDAGVQRLSAKADGGFRIGTTRGEVEARDVVVATGSFHVPRIPEVAGSLPRRVVQVHSSDYRNERALPPGGVLVVGSGQSGVQIVEELRAAGRPTFLSLGSAGWAPRRYRGRDIFAWLATLASRGAEYGVPFPTVDKLPDPRARLAANPQLSGHGGGHDIDLRAMAADGTTLLARIARVDGERLTLAPGLGATLARSEAFFGERFQPMIERFIAAAAIDAPPDVGERSTFEPPEVEQLDLAAAGISTVIWATGYRLDYGWIDLPIFDELGFPRHARGVSEVPGLYFLGLLWQHTQASATIFGPTLDGPHVVAAMGLPVEVEMPTPPSLS